MKSSAVGPFFIYASQNGKLMVTNDLVIISIMQHHVVNLLHELEVRNGEPKKKEKSLKLKFKEVLTAFVHNTTFPGFSQISNSQSYFGKIFWTAFLIVGAYFTVEQSCQLMKQYIKLVQIQNPKKKFLIF